MGHVASRTFRAGNSLDRALLLAALLERCGRESRIVRGTLPDPLAEKLLETSLARDPRSTPLGAFLEDGVPAGEQEASRRFCTGCGKPLKPDQEFCASCGMKVGN